MLFRQSAGVGHKQAHVGLREWALGRGHGRITDGQHGQWRVISSASIPGAETSGSCPMMRRGGKVGVGDEQRQLGGGAGRRGLLDNR